MRTLDPTSMVILFLLIQSNSLDTLPYSVLFSCMLDYLLEK
ncbi:uncharacterized protein METZ01_LOCUS471137 [marine metagenome]|uniref:Uncharacterized protein n=1 Tax=marine metagenome TaxID=408172 RepID=A0A383BEN2_9ZZZZ